MLSELFAAIYEVLVSSGDSDEGDYDQEIVFLKHLEFFIISRVFFCATFAVNLVCSNDLWADTVLLPTIPLKFSMTSFISDIISQFGYFISTYAYLCYY